MNKIGELNHRIFSFIKARHRDIAMSPPSALAKNIAALRFKILTKIKDKNTWIKIRGSYWMEYNMVRNLLAVRNCEFEIRN